jgi:hypothetical protein
MGQLKFITFFEKSILPRYTLLLLQNADCSGKNTLWSVSENPSRYTYPSNTKNLSALFMLDVDSSVSNEFFPKNSDFISSRD